MREVHLVAVVLAVALIATMLWEVFESVVLPRQVSRRFRLTRVYIRNMWHLWSALGHRVQMVERREKVLAIFGPLALLGMLALYALLLIVAFAMLLWGLGSPLMDPSTHPVGFGTDLYFSGTTFLTLGLGDVLPRTGVARGITVIEVGTGFGLFALVIGYVPVLYQAFSRRETRISLLDAHAGSPPTAAALVLRHPPNRHSRRVTSILAEWENWSAELLETHLSYPILAYCRSQHENQSWVAAMTFILDVCALILACSDGLLWNEEMVEQAAFTFAMARHAASDLDQYFGTPPVTREERISPDDRTRLWDLLRTLRPSTGREAPVDAREVEGRLDDFRTLYEPYLERLAAYLLMALPRWIPDADALDDWQTTADNVTAPSITTLSAQRKGRRPRV
jgi:hypothetical protein